MEAPDHEQVEQAMQRLLADQLDDPPRLELTQFHEWMKAQPEAMLVLTVPRHGSDDDALYRASTLIEEHLQELTPAGWTFSLSPNGRPFNAFDDALLGISMYELRLRADPV